MGVPVRSVLAALALFCALVCVSSARVGQHQQHALIRSVDEDGSHKSTNLLNTYYFDATKPHIELSSRGSARPERTALTVKLAQGGVSRFMAVVTPKPSGMTHSVSNTWQALKNLATMFTRMNSINQKSPAGRRLFPRAAVAVGAASDNAPAKGGGFPTGTPVKLDLDSLITIAEATNQRNTWAEVTPSSVLLLPSGQSIGAVADVLDVTWDKKAGILSLELDLVHNPHTMSEFEAHAKQTLDVTDAHYHFNTESGVKVDAHAFLNGLDNNGFRVEGLHIFAKGNAKYGNCWDTTITADTLQAPITSQVTVKVTVAGVIPECACLEDGGLCQDTCYTLDGGTADFCCADSECCGNTCCGSSCCTDPTDICCTDPSDICCTDPTGPCCTDPSDICCLDPTDICCTDPSDICCTDPSDICCTDPSDICCTDPSDICCTDPFDICCTDPSDICCTDPSDICCTDPSDICCTDPTDLCCTDPQGQADICCTDPSDICCTDPSDICCTDPSDICCTDPSDICCTDPSDICCTDPSDICCTDPSDVCCTDPSNVCCTDPTGICCVDPTGPCCTDPTGPCCTDPTGPCCTDPTGPCCTDPTDPCCTDPTGPCCTDPTGPCCTDPTGICCTDPTDICCTDPSDICCTDPSDPSCITRGEGQTPLKRGAAPNPTPSAKTDTAPILKHTKPAPMLNHTKPTQRLNHTKPTLRPDHTKPTQGLNHTKVSPRLNHTKPAPRLNHTKATLRPDHTKPAPRLNHTKVSPRLNQTKPTQRLNQTKPTERLNQTKPTQGLNHTKPTLRPDHTKPAPRLNHTKPAPHTKPTPRPNHTKPAPRHGSQRKQLAPQDLSVFLYLVGPGSINEARSSKLLKPRSLVGHGKAPTRSQARQLDNTDVLEVLSDASGVATATLNIDGPGPIIVYAGVVDNTATYQPTALVINGQAASGGGGVGSHVARLLLAPTKSYRHCDDAITLQAYALDTNNAPVVNATVAIAVYGDCEPTTQHVSGTTDEHGIATLTLLSKEPGVVSVMAAAVNSQGAPVLSQPSHVFFFNERHHAEEREREYFGNHEYDDEDKHSDADRYTQVALQRVQQKVQLHAA